MNFERLKSIVNDKGYKVLPVKVWQYLQVFEFMWEWTNKRTWKFKGLVIKIKKPKQHTGTFTIRWKSSWVIVEKVYPLSYPKFEKLLLLDEYKVRRSKLYYIREKVGKDAKFRSIIKSKDRNKDLV
jgi:large subunit ribosomal protein L19